MPPDLSHSGTHSPCTQTVKNTLLTEPPKQKAFLVQVIAILIIFWSIYLFISDLFVGYSFIHFFKKDRNSKCNCGPGTNPHSMGWTQRKRCWRKNRRNIYMGFGWMDWCMGGWMGGICTVFLGFFYFILLCLDQIWLNSLHGWIDGMMDGWMMGEWVRCFLWIGTEIVSASNRTKIPSRGQELSSWNICL